MRGRGKKLNSVHALARKTRSVPEANRYIEFRLQKLMSESQSNLPGVYSKQTAQKILDSLERWGQGLQNDFPHGVFNSLPAPSNSYGSSLSADDSWMREVYNAKTIDPKYPASVIALRAEVRSWILNPRTNASVVRDLELAVNWQKEHVSYLQDAVRNNPTRHPAWSMYKLLSKQNSNNKAKPRSEAVQMAMAELKRLEALLANYNNGGPFILGPAYQAMRGDQWVLSTNARKFAWQEAIEGNIASMDEICNAWRLATATTKIDTANVKNIERDELMKAGRYFLHAAEHKLDYRRPWPHDDWQKQLDEEDYPFVAGADPLVLDKYIKPYYGDLIKNLEPVESIESAMQSVKLFTQTSVYSHRNYIPPRTEAMEHYYTIPASEEALVDALDKGIEVDIYFEQHLLPKTNNKTNREQRQKKVWKAVGIASMRHQDSEGKFHTVRIQAELGETSTRDREKAKKMLFDKLDWIDHPNATVDEEMRLADFPGLGYYKSVAAKDGGYFNKGLEKLEDKMNQKPITKVQNRSDFLPMDNCKHEKFKWVECSTSRSNQKSLLRKHCLVCNHSRVEVRFKHQVKEHRTIIERALSAGSSPKILLAEYNAYLLRTGARVKPYDSMRELLDSEALVD